jgi:hypothetical protein
VAVILSAARVPSVFEAAGEYLHPASVVGDYLPRGCILTSEAAPGDLMAVIERQRQLYGLSLQTIVVCRSPQTLPGFEARFVGLPFGDRDPCRPLLKGCCSCQTGRHVIVMAAERSGNGSVLVRANLIQPRADYLRMKFRDVRSGWIFVGALFAAFILVVSLAVWKSIAWLQRRAAPVSG